MMRARLAQQRQPIPEEDDEHAPNYLGDSGIVKLQKKINRYSDILKSDKKLKRGEYNLLGSKQMQDLQLGYFKRKGMLEVIKTRGDKNTEQPHMRRIISDPKKRKQAAKAKF